MKKIFKFLSPGIIPFSICLFLGIFILAYRIFHLPSPAEVADLIQRWFVEYSWWLLFGAAFIEGIFIIGMYFPGSLAIALALYTLGKTPVDLLYIGILSFVAFLAANILNYYLGKYGYYKLLLWIGKKSIIERMQLSMKKNGNKIFFLTGFFPNFIAIASICAGIGRLNILKTILLQATSLLFWVTIWTIVGSFVVKKINLQDNNQSIYLLVLILLWGIFLVIKENYKIKRGEKLGKFK